MIRKEHRPDLRNVTDVILSVLREHVDTDMIKRCMDQGGRSDTVGMLSSTLAIAADEAPLYWMSGVGKVFNGREYQEFSRDEMYVALRKFVMNPQYAFAPSVMRNGSVQDLCQTIMTTIRTKRLDPDRDLISFNNGVLSLSDLSMTAHNPALTPFAYFDFDFDPEAECPKWRAFLDEVLPAETPDESGREKFYTRRQDLLQEFLGCALMDRRKARVEKMMILCGSGSNGKSVVAHVITSLLGDANCTHFSFDEMLTGGDVGKNTAKMNGKLLNYAEEIQAVQSARHGDRLKAIVSGEPVAARTLYGEPFSADALPLIIANANQLPRIEDSSRGLMRRMIVISFDIIIPPDKQDLTLANKLDEERSGIFNWLLEGLQRYISQNYQFSHQDVVNAGAEEFMQSNSSILQFMAENDRYPKYNDTENMVARPIYLKDLYDEYTVWCQARHIRCKNFIEVRNALDAAGFEKRRASKGIRYDCYHRKDGPKLIKQQEEFDAYLESSKRSVMPFIMADGRIAAVGVKQAALYTRSSMSWLKIMLAAGKLDSSLLTKKDKELMGLRTREPIFDLEELYAVVGTLYQRSPDKQRIILDDIQECINFNSDMSRIRKPFRKYVAGMSKSELRCAKGDDIIFVEKDWILTNESEQEAVLNHETEKLHKQKL